jgi:uncharacterized membrane protein YdjX (TVP38/TMEM64 family)
VPPRQYALGTFLGVLPGAVLYNFVGAAAREPTSPMFIGGASVMVLLAIVGGALARRVWRAEPDGTGDAAQGGDSPDDGV